MFKILPFKQDSTGADILCRNLPAEKVNPDDSRSLASIGINNIVLNWGTGWTNRIKVHANQPKAVCRAVDKLIAFECFREADVPHPRHTANKKVAQKWLTSGDIVYSRTTMVAERGRGICVHKDASEILPESERMVYVRGFPTAREFRVHVAFGNVIEVNEKKRRNGTNPDPFVRSHSDWVFCVYNLQPYPTALLDESIKAVESLGLDFGGVDIASDADGNVCVFEVNTAPWINRESTTLAYKDAFCSKFPQ